MLNEDQECYMFLSMFLINFMLDGAKYKSDMGIKNRTRVNYMLLMLIFVAMADNFVFPLYG